jgi:lysophospholipase L1-like esterase
VYGYYLDGLRWTDMLQNDLTNQPDYKHVNIYNFAVPGESIATDNPIRFDSEGVMIGGRLVDRVKEMYPENSDSFSLPEIVILVPSINEIVASKQPTIQGKAEQATLGILEVVAYFNKLGVENVKVTQMLSPTERWSETCSFDVNYAVDYFNSYLSEQIDGVVPYSLESMKTSKNSSENGSDEAYFKEANTINVPNDGLHPDEQGQVVLKMQIEAELLKIIASLNR